MSRPQLALTRVREARRRGQLGEARLWRDSAALGALALVVSAGTRRAGTPFVRWVAQLWGCALSPTEAAGQVVSRLAQLAVPVLLAVFTLVLVAGLAQTGFRFNGGAIGGRGTRAPGTVQVLAAAAVAMIGVIGGRHLIVGLAQLHTGRSVVAAVLSWIEWFGWRALTVTALLGGFQWLGARARLRRALTPSRAELQEERRWDQGDPRIRAERRRRHRERALTSEQRPK